MAEEEQAELAEMPLLLASYWDPRRREMVLDTRQMLVEVDPTKTLDEVHQRGRERVRERESSPCEHIPHSAWEPV